jgi:hypothetical protein
MTALAAWRLWFTMAVMKPHVMFVKALLLAACFSVTGPLLAQDSYGPKPDQSAPDASNKPAGDSKIPGLVLSRSNGGFLGLEVDPNSNTFKLSFYDEKKKPVAPDVATATISWYFNNTGTERLLYGLDLGGDGKCLVSPRVIIRPLPLRARILLFSSASDSNPVDSYQNQNLTSLAAGQ